MFQKILPPERSTNGRVDILRRGGPQMQNLFNMYDRIPAKQCVTLRDPTEGIWNNTVLSGAFFSAANMQIIQNAIRKGVCDMSNGQYIISQQPCDVLKQIMRSVFLQHSVNNCQPIRDQVAALNQFVIDWCVRQLYGETKGYLKYLQDASTLVVPLAPPTMSSTTSSRKVHRMPNWF